MEEKCLDCKWCEVIEESGNGFIGESIFRCKISEEERLYKLAYEALSNKWAREYDFLKEHPEDEISQIRERELWNELIELKEEMMCRYPECFTKQGKYIWENGLEGQVEDVMEKIPCSREMAIEYVCLMNRVFNGID